MISAFDFAQNLATAKSVPDVIECTRTHARAGGVCASSGKDIDRFDMGFIAPALGTKQITPTKR